MHKLNDFLVTLDGYLGGHPWFMILLIGTGLFFTIYLGFPQIRYFRHAIRITKGKYDHSHDIGDTSHFQSLATALSGTVGTGNIAGVALAIHLGGPAALFWMLITAAIGMCTKMVEVSISHKYRDILPDGSVSGGPMYYMKKRLNITDKKWKSVKDRSHPRSLFCRCDNPFFIWHRKPSADKQHIKFSICHLRSEAYYDRGHTCSSPWSGNYRRHKENCKSDLCAGSFYGPFIPCWVLAGYLFATLKISFPHSCRYLGMLSPVRPRQAASWVPRSPLQ